MTFIKTKLGKRQKLTDSLSDEHLVQFVEKVKCGEFEEVSITETFNVRVKDRFTFSKFAVVVQCETDVNDTILRHRGWGFVYWKMVEYRDGYLCEHVGERIPYLFNNGNAVELDAMDYAKSSVTLRSSDEWEQVVYWWKTPIADAD